MKKYYSFVALSLLATTLGMPFSAQETFGKPKTPVNLKITGDDATGMAVFTWDPVTEDVDGNKIPAENVQYLIYNANGNTIARVSENRFSRLEYKAGKVVGVRYSIRAGAGDYTGDLSKIVSGDLAHSDYTSLGRDYIIPAWESFNNGMGGLTGLVSGNNIITQKVITNISTDNQWKGVVSQDNDNGLLFVGLSGSAIPGELITPYVDLKVARNPRFIFHHLNRGEKDDNYITVYAIAEGSDTKEKLYTYSEPLKAQQWLKHEIPLDAYKGKKVRILLECSARGVPTFMMDNFRFIDEAASNLSVADFKAPATSVINKPMRFSVCVANNGTKSAENYKVILYREGKAVAEAVGQALEPLHSTTVELEYTADATSVGTATFNLGIDYAADELAYDNTTPEATVTLTAPALPVPDALAAETAGADVRLTWQAPDASGIVAKAITDSFEDLGLFEYENSHLGSWSVYDGDKGYSMLTSASDVSFPGYITPKSFGVLSEEVHGLPWKARSGKQFMSAFPAVGANRNDWLISPRLQCVEQTITMYLSSVPAKSVPYEVMYSENSTDPADFVLLSKGSIATSDWTEVKADLPATAKYFALHLPKGGNSSVLLVDDVTFVPEAVESGLTLVGYNVYRDGEKITATPVADAVYVDNAAAKSGYTYAVSAVYDKGESATGAPVSAGGLSGIDDVSAQAEILSVRRFTMEGIEISSVAEANGLYIEQVRYADGTVKTYKRVVR